MTTELIEGMPEADYHRLERMSASRLKVLERGTPRHLTAMLAEDRNTPAMRIGSAMHCLALLGEEAFKAQFAVAPDVDRRTKDGKAEYAAFVESCGSRTVLTVGEYEDARNMAEAVRTDPHSRDILDACPLRELTALGEVEYDGHRIPCKGRLDLYNKSGILADLKSIGQDASAYNCEKYALEWGVWLQMALYRRMAVSHNAAHIVFVESKPPYCVAVRQMLAMDIEAFDPILNLCIKRYARWMKNPDAGWDTDPIRLPEWKIRQIENTPH